MLFNNKKGMNGMMMMMTDPPAFFGRRKRSVDLDEYQQETVKLLMDAENTYPRLYKHYRKRKRTRRR